MSNNTVWLDDDDDPERKAVFRACRAVDGVLRAQDVTDGIALKALGLVLYHYLLRVSGGDPDAVERTIEALLKESLIENGIVKKFDA